MNVPVVMTTARPRTRRPRFVSTPHAPSLPDQDAHGVALLEVEVRRALQLGLDAELIRLLVALRPRRTHARPLARIEHAELDARGVRVQPHDAAQRIDLPHHLPLRLPADGRVAGHLPHGIEVLREHQCLATEPSRRARRLNPGMPRPDDDDIIKLGIVELAHFKRRLAVSWSVESVCKSSASPRDV